MTCEIKDHGAELREMAQYIYEGMQKTESFKDFYTHFGTFSAGMELAIHVTECREHEKLFRLLMSLMVVSYLRARLNTNDDSLFATVRNEFSNIFHEKVMETAVQLNKEKQR